MPVVAVDGFVRSDWDLLRQADGGARMSRSWGGTTMMTALLTALGFDVRGASRPPPDLLPSDPHLRHTFRLWSRHDHAWRVDEVLGPTTGDIAISPVPPVSHQPAPNWSVLRSVGPISRSSAVRRLDHQPQQTVIVLNVDDLRADDIQVSRELSWERAAQDVVWELTHDPAVNSIPRRATAIVLFGLSGAVMTTGDTHTLIFDPNSIEGTWEMEHPGGVPGSTEWVTAALARTLATEGAPGLIDAVRCGLAAGRALHVQGWRLSPDGVLTLPVETCSAVLAGQPAPFAAVPIEDPSAHLHAPAPGNGGRGSWSILRDQHPGGLNGLASRILVEGVTRAVSDVPVGRFGALVTLDRQEIEGFRSIRALMVEHRRRNDPKPLSIAAFGAPGAGKSFGVTQVARSLLPGEIEVLEFNLAQLGSQANLIQALHQVRDVGIAGRVPLVFWDEFDTSLAGKSLGWLRYFLAPMQDGQFQEGDVVHPVPPSIFVFVGGTARNMSEFGRDSSPDEFRAAKGPDFVSRLRGYVNLLGPNPTPHSHDSADPWFVIRRAILVRSILRRMAPQLFHGPGDDQHLAIDPGVLRALIGVPEFRHGARSVEAIIAMSRLAGETAFQRSCLPSEEQLDLHVDGTAFLALVQHLRLRGRLLESLAEATHEVYRESCRARGETNEAAGLTYDELPEDLRQQNREAVWDIAEKLDRSGYLMVPARSDEPAFTFPGDALDALARAEHQRWAKSISQAGWRYGATRDVAARTHPDLVAWEDLDRQERQKDLDSVASIPSILARAGYAVVPARRDRDGRARRPSRDRSEPRP